MPALKLARIRAAEEHFEQVYQPEVVGSDSDVYKIVAPVSLSFDIYKDKIKFHLVGRAATTLEIACGRCLEPFTFQVDAPFDLRYEPLTPTSGAGEHEVPPEDMDTAFYENDEIDLGQLMQERFYLALPMKPICKDDCRGLCANCGTNLNNATCDCKTEWDDPRLAALKALKKES